MNNTILFFDTSVGTFNRGDQIIMESVYREFKPLLDRYFRINFATHLVNYHGKYTDKAKVKCAENAKYKFICGTDLIWRYPFNQSRRHTLQLSSIVNDGLYNNSILLGPGVKNDKPYRFQLPLDEQRGMEFYRKTLSDEYYHSVRDEAAVQYLQKIEGLKVINTGCPTLWMLDENHCQQIPKAKTNSGKVCFALSSERKNEEHDRIIAETCLNNYQEVYFWVQHIRDDEYVKSLVDSSRIKFIYALEEYDQLLKQDIDYIGTRLHGGIYALQHKKRSIIISVDHRASGMKTDNNLPTLARDRVTELHDLINSSFETHIRLNTEGIRLFKNQFV